MPSKKGSQQRASRSTETRLDDVELEMAAMKAELAVIKWLMAATVLGVWGQLLIRVFAP